MSEPSRATLPLHCSFCGSVWDSGLYCSVTIPGGPEGRNVLPLPVCYLCHATNTRAELDAQFQAAFQASRARGKAREQ